MKRATDKRDAHGKAEAPRRAIRDFLFYESEGMLLVRCHGCSWLESVSAAAQVEFLLSAIQAHRMTCTGKRPAYSIEDVKRDPVAKTMADLVTPKQLVALRSIACALAISAERECMTVLKCMPEELSKRAASALIDHIKDRYAGYPATGHEHTGEECAGPKEVVVGSIAERRARAIVAAGLVERDYDGFNVTAPGIKRQSYRVWRDEEGRGVCDTCHIPQVIEGPAQDSALKHCKGCDGLIRFIAGPGRVVHPVDPGPVEVDGRRVLVFEDGSVGATNPWLTVGYVSHFATCAEADRFRRR